MLRVTDSHAWIQCRCWTTRDATQSDLSETIGSARLARSAGSHDLLNLLGELAVGSISTNERTESRAEPVNRPRASTMLRTCPGDATYGFPIGRVTALRLPLSAGRHDESDCAEG